MERDRERRPRGPTGALHQGGFLRILSTRWQGVDGDVHQGEIGQLDDLGGRLKGGRNQGTTVVEQGYSDKLEPM